MRPLPLLLPLLLPATGCVIASDHVATELQAICTGGVPLPFEVVAADRAVARVPVDVGASIDAPDARAVLATVTFATVRGAADFGFADALAMDLVSPGRPDARVLELSPVPAGSPFTAEGDAGVDLADYLTADSLAIRVAFDGEVPAGAFVASMAACLDVEGIVVEDEEE